MTTEGEVRIGGRPLRYRATAATVNLKDAGGKETASVFHVSYVRQEPDASRPVVFAFNGGPGSSSLWLHLGLFGPRRIVFGDTTVPPAPPYRLADNEHSVLDVADVVLIDPVSTGWSRTPDPERAADFHGLKEDTESVAEFIRLWCSREGRWSSPKYLAGESYGTTRAASLAGHLTDKLGIYLNGVALISSVLAFVTSRPDLGNDLPYVMLLPTYAAAAWYHRRIDRKRWRTLASAAADAEAFALGDYARALLRGSALSSSERDGVAGRLAELTGLRRDFLDECDLRVTPGRWFKELMRSERRTVGRLDARFLGIDRDAAGEEPEYDPAYAVIQGVYTAAVNDYLRRELGFDEDGLYEVISEKVQPWKWGDAGDGRYPEVASQLRGAMHRNRAMRVFLASGYYDAATPYLAAEWTLDHMRVDRELRSNIQTARYEAGHMMYIHEPSMAALSRDLRRFVQAQP